MKNNSIIIRVLLTFLLCLTISACSLSATNSTETEIANQQTIVAQTLIALQTQMAMNATPEVPVFPTNTQGLLPTATLTQGPTVIAATSTPYPTESPTYRIGSVVDVTYTDDTVVKPNEVFTKTWRLTNGGTGTWTSNFKVYFVSGDAMGGPASRLLGTAVGPGQSIDISMDLTAPATSKTYQGKWMLQTEGGINFGLGTNADGPFWVKVKVDQNFVITNAVPIVSPASYTGACPTDIVFTANITATSSGTATYYYITSLGNSPTYNLAFTAAGTLTTGTYTVTVTSDQTVTASVYNDYPNHQEFPTVLSVVVDCTP